MNREEIETKALAYLKENKAKLFELYLDRYNPLEEQIAYFTAGPSGAGKTEYAQQLLETENNLIHLDIDKIREFFSEVGYDGNNSDLYQKPAGRGVQYLFDEMVKNRLLSFVLDSNLSNAQIAKENMEKLLKKGYRIEIYYIYNDLEKCYLYTKQREAVTKRVVPEDVFFKSVIMSRKTTYEIKKLYGENVILSVIDKRNDGYYADMSSEKFYQVIPDIEQEK